MVRIDGDKEFDSWCHALKGRRGLHILMHARIDLLVII